MEEPQGHLHSEDFGKADLDVPTSRALEFGSIWWMTKYVR